MKSASVIASVEATNPPTFTCEVGEKRTPLGLRRKTRPLAVREPWMTEGSAPTTRLSRTERAEGCSKWTVWPAPTEKLSQLIAARSVVWRTVMTWPTVATAAAPAVTFGATGKGPAQATPATPRACRKAKRRRRVGVARRAGHRSKVIPHF